MGKELTFTKSSLYFRHFFSNHFLESLLILSPNCSFLNIVTQFSWLKQTKIQSNFDLSFKFLIVRMLSFVSCISFFSLQLHVEDSRAFWLVEFSGLDFVGCTFLAHTSLFFCPLYRPLYQAGSWIQRLVNVHVLSLLLFYPFYHYWEWCVLSLAHA